MADWSDYKREEREVENGVTGKLRCVITAVEEGNSKAGNPMIIVTLRPSGVRFTVKHFLVKGEYFNRRMTEFFDAFPEIGDGNFDFLTWVGCVGAAMFALDDNGYTKVRYFLSPERAANLPEFEGEIPERQTITSLEEADPDDDLPFDV